MDQGVGHEVKRLREERDWSQAKLAVEAGMSVSGVSMIENGQRNLTTTTLAKLAHAFGVEMADLFPTDQVPLPSPAAAEMEDVLRAIRENMELLGAYFDNPPDEETADAAIEDFYELAPQPLEILTRMNREEIGKYARQIAAIMREFGQVNRRLEAWNLAQYGHLHRDIG